MESIERRIEESYAISDDKIAESLRRAGVEVRPDKAEKNNVGYLAKVKGEYGTYWQMARNVYIRMIETGAV